MINLLSVVGLFCSLFILSAFISWFVLSRGRRKVSYPPLMTPLKLRQGASVMRSQLIDVSPRGIWVSAPRSESDVVPIRPSESFCVEFSDTNGINLYFCRVLERRSGSVPALLLEHPRKVIVRERRSDRRFRFEPTVPAIIDDRIQVRVADMSAGGARVESFEKLKAGEVIAFRIQQSPATVFGWVLDSRNVDGCSISRILFERKVPLEYVAALKNSIA